MRLSELCEKRVRNENGKSLGRVAEVHIQDSRVTALTCGARGFFQRLGASRAGHRVAWERVVRVTSAEIIIADAKHH